MSFTHCPAQCPPEMGVSCLSPQSYEGEHTNCFPFQTIMPRTNWTIDDDEKLLCLIREYQWLYDVGHRSYRDKQKKLNSCDEIASQFRNCTGKYSMPSNRTSSVSICNPIRYVFFLPEGMDVARARGGWWLTYPALKKAFTVPGYPM